MNEKSNKVFLQRRDYLDILEDLFQSISWGDASVFVPVVDCVGHVAAEPIFAAASSPRHDTAAMDGIAVVAALTTLAREDAPVRLDIGDNAFWINTGHRLPNNCNAVIMVEDLVLESEDTRARIVKPVVNFENVRSAGEDFVDTELLFVENHCFCERDLPCLLAAGIKKILVRKKPLVAIIPTGDELTEEINPAGESITESNSKVLSVLVKKWGGEPLVSPIIPDDKELLLDCVQKFAHQADIIVMLAGSSAGKKDFAIDVLEELGCVIAHGANIRPGKPVIVGTISKKPFIGLPGYPLANYLDAELFLQPLIRKVLRLEILERSCITAVAGKKIVSPVGEYESVFVKLGKINEKTIMVPMPKGSGTTKSLSRADGILRIPQMSQGINKSEAAEVELLISEKQIGRTAIVIGSHDVCIDILGNEISKSMPGFGISSAHVGSMGGFVAVSRGEAHFAGVHSLEEDTGEYNVAFAQQFLPEYRLINLVNRVQGLIVAKNNPLGIKSLADIVEGKLRFVNRQKGSGTRQLLDYELKKSSISEDSILGYEREVLTHLAVAIAVKVDSADVGLGVQGVADSLDLSFIPLADERFDIIMGPAFFEHPLFERMMSILCSDNFRNTLNAMVGYRAERTGEVISERG